LGLAAARPNLLDKKPEAGDAPGGSGLKPSDSLVERDAARCSALVPCRSRRQAARSAARAQLAFAVRFLAAGFFIGAFFFATDFAFAAALAIVIFPLHLFRPNQFRT
jgi:hypothetical protein